MESVGDGTLLEEVNPLRRELWEFIASPRFSFALCSQWQWHTPSPLPDQATHCHATLQVLPLLPSSPIHCFFYNFPLTMVSLSEEQKSKKTRSNTRRSVRCVFVCSFVCFETISWVLTWILIISGTMKDSTGRTTHPMKRLGFLRPYTLNKLSSDAHACFRFFSSGTFMGSRGLASTLQCV